MRMVAHFRHATFVFVIVYFALGDMGFQALIEVHDAGNGICYCKHYQNDCNDSYLVKLAKRVRKDFLVNIPNVVKLRLAGL